MTRRRAGNDCRGLAAYGDHVEPAQAHFGDEGADMDIVIDGQVWTSETLEGAGKLVAPTGGMSR